jgi:hypothetical protein
MIQLGRDGHLAMVYQRVLKLPCDDVRSGIGFKSTLDAGLRQLVNGLFKASEGFKIQFRDDTGGHLWAIVTRGAHKMELEGRYGQNSSFSDGKKQLFVSYTIRAETAAGGKASSGESVNETVELFGKVGGVVLSVVIAYAICSRINNKTAMLILALPIFGAMIYAGIWAGRKAARMIAGQMSGAGNGALSDADAAQAKAAWQRLTNGIDSVTDGYTTA